MRYKHWFKLLVLGLLGGATLAVHANLQVFPTRVVLTDKKKVAQITLRHMGNQPESYRITVMFYRMNPDGSMVEVKTPERGERFAAEYFRYSPRVVNLQPKIEQVVRLMLRRPANLPDGDYRAHLKFEATSAAQPEDANATDGEFKMSLKARLAVAVPIIVRVGDPQSQISLENLDVVTLPDGKKAFSVEINSVGLSFVYGDLRAYQVSSDGKEAILVGEVNGVSSYLPKRKAVFVFSNEAQFSPQRKGTLRLDLKTPAEEGAVVLATASKALQ